MFTDSHIIPKLSAMATCVLLGTMGALAAGDSTEASVNRTPGCGGHIATIWGTDGPDTILGTHGDDVIHGLDGNDTIYLLGGNDIVCGGEGDDNIYGVSGQNVIYGDGGNDSVYGGNGNDTIDGGAGDDTIYGGDGDDSINGGDGDDKLNGGNGADRIDGGRGNDSLLGGNEADTLNGGGGEDLLNGGDGDDVLNSDEGHDTLNGGNGDDRIDGGSGNDMIRGGSGSDSLDGGPGNDTLYGDVGDDVLKGGEGADLMDGGAGNDRLYGGDGEDYILGGDGEDLINGGPGADTMISGPGKDTAEWFYPVNDNMIDLNADDYLQIPPAYTCNSERPFSVAMPLFNDTGINLVRTKFRDMICPGDTLAMISGNGSGAFDGDWVNRSGAALARELPGVNLVALTSGLENVEIAARSVRNPVEYVGYIYEPNWHNMPEFDWDFSRTLHNLERVNRLVRSHGLKSWTKPTGRPLLQSYLFHFGWDYGKIGRQMDGMAVQTQTYCKEGPDRYGQAMEKLRKEYREAGVTYKWYTQIAIHDDGYNVVSIPQGLACAREARERGVPGVFIWWSTDEYPEMGQFLKGLGR